MKRLASKTITLSLVYVAAFASDLMLTSCHSTSSGGAQKTDSPILDALERADYRKALQLAQSANTPEAKFYIGRIYAEGWGVDAKLADAARYYKEAADGGFVRAKVFLAGAYMQGRGIQKDPAAARQLLQQAAAQGDVQAKYVVDMFFGNHSHRQTAAEEVQSKQIVLAACDAGDPFATLMVGKGYSGESIQKPEEKALAAKYLLAAANSNTAFPGGLAAVELLNNGSRLGISTVDEKAVLFRYMDSGDAPLATLYVATCIRNKSNPICDPVQVIKYSGGTDPVGAVGHAPAYLASLTDAQKQEGRRLAAQWKPAPSMPSVPPLFYVPPIFGR